MTAEGFRILLSVLALWLIGLSSARSGTRRVPQETALPATAADLSQGRQQFEDICSTCHGLDAAGAEGPNIQSMPATLGDQAVVNIIRNGAPGGMPAFPAISEAQASQIVAYIRSLTAGSPAAALKGDPEKGESVYASRKCADCHVISGEGGDLGPELTQIGALRNPDALRATLLNPGDNLPLAAAVRDRGKMTQYLMFRVVTKDGHAFEGTRVGEDTFHIVLEDSKGVFRSFRKADLQTFEKEMGKSLMPSYKDNLSEGELDDLVTYLAGLKGTQAAK